MTHKTLAPVDQSATTHNKVSMHELASLDISDQLKLLVDAGYTMGGLHQGRPYLKELFSFISLDKRGYIATDVAATLNAIDRTSVGFVLKDTNGCVIDEYTFILYSGWFNDVEPFYIIMKAWVHGTATEESFLMPSRQFEKYNDCGLYNDFWEPLVCNDPIITAYERKYLEESMLTMYEQVISRDQETKIIRLCNSRYALAFTYNTLDDGSIIYWIGVPACGDGDIEQYTKTLLLCERNSFMVWQWNIRNNASMTFATYEEAEAWAKTKRLRVTTEHNCLNPET